MDKANEIYESVLNKIENSVNNQIIKSNDNDNDNSDNKNIKSQETILNEMSKEYRERLLAWVRYAYGKHFSKYLNMHEKTFIYFEKAFQYKQSTKLRIEPWQYFEYACALYRYYEQLLKTNEKNETFIIQIRDKSYFYFKKAFISGSQIPSISQKYFQLGLHQSKANSNKI